MVGRGARVGAWRKEEASVAGESPDRSKQHASSAEATSGSGAAVPGPAAGDRDPRLAVAGEKARVDQATAVLSTRELRGSAGTAVDEDGSTGSKGSTTGGGARQQASLASWVRSADEAGAGAEDTSEAETGSEEAADGAEDRAAGAGEGAETEAGETEDRSGEEGAAEAESADEESADEESADEESAEAESDGAVDAGGEEAADGSEEEGAATSENGNAPDGSSDADADADADADVDVDADAGADAEGAGGAEDAQDAQDAETVEAADADAEGDSEGDAGSKPPVDQPTTMLKLGDAKSAKKSEKPEKPEKSEESGKAVDQPTTMLKLGGGTKSQESSDSSGKPEESEKFEKSEKQPKGQPEKPAPSWAAKSSAATSGKSGESGKSDKPESSAAAPDGKSASRAETDAERTSKFVALKPLDEPRSPQPKVPQPKTAQPEPGQAKPADATAALPRVGPERTTQQPLPPKPPLDLLAELTNTPPPPETPVRTVLRRIKIWTPLVVLLVIIFAIVQAVRPLPTPTLGLSAEETYTFGGGKLDLPWPGQGQSAIEVEGVGMVGSEGAQTPRPIASVTKIMTAYVTLQEHPLKGNDGGPQITVDQQAEDESKNEDESTAAVKKGQKFTERQMLQMLMIPSGNNAARLLARWDSDPRTFVGKMNAAAKQLGMTHTTYTDPSGLDKSTVSTAVDQLKLAKKVMQDPVFRSIVGMAKADIPGLTGPIYNNNDLLVKQVGVIGLKTGSSTPAGGNLVWAATKVVDGKTQTIYGAVLNQDARTGRVWDSLQLAITNSQKLIDKVQQSLTTATVVKKGEVVGYVDDQLGGRTPVVATRNMKAVGWPGLRTALSIGGDGKAVPHEAKAGTVVGKLTVGDGSSHAVTIPVALQKDLAEPGYGAKFTRLG
ncbi:serine hydrolase [Streptomyces glomeratus]